jgi:hypothetical protein
MKEFDAEQLFRECARERQRKGAIVLPVSLDLESAMMLIANLQLALRHPGNNGRSARLAREVIDGLIERIEKLGYVANARVARLGDNPECDEVRRQ